MAPGQGSIFLAAGPPLLHTMFPPAEGRGVHGRTNATRRHGRSCCPLDASSRDRQCRSGRLPERLLQASPPLHLDACARAQAQACTQRPRSCADSSSSYMQQQRRPQRRAETCGPQQQVQTAASSRAHSEASGACADSFCRGAILLPVWAVKRARARR